MESKASKYHRIRPQLGDTGLFLTRKNEFVSKVIRWCDDAEFSHVGIYFLFEGCYFVMDANAKGVAPALLSKRIKECADFCFIKPKEVTECSLMRAIRRADKGIKYDLWNGIKEISNRKIGLNLSITNSNSKDICSDYVREFAIENNMVELSFDLLKLALPQDYIRFNNNETTIILL